LPGSRKEALYAQLWAGLERLPLDDGQEVLRDQAVNSLVPFTQFTKADYQPSAHHLLIASYLEDVEAGKIDRLMIFMPPQHGKSELATRRFPAWFLGRNPRKRVISASYNADFASEFGREVRNIIDDDLYRNLWQINLRQDSKAANRWNTDAGGAYISAGIGTGITGRGADLGLIDDPFKDRKEAESQTVRDSIWKWYTSTFYTRLAPWAPVVMTLTRWHEDDLAGRCLKEMAKGGDVWTVLSLAAIAPGPDALGRQGGEALWPERYSLPALERIRGVLPAYDWESLYQQAPVTPTGNIFKRHWWRFFREIPGTLSLKVQSWDTGFKAKDANDWSVCTTWGVPDLNIFLLDRYKERLEFPELKREVVAQAVRHTPDAILVEDKASGQSLIQELQRETHLPIVPIKVDRDKTARAHAVTPLIEGGRVYLPEWASWTDDYITTLAAFPRGKFDDEVDSTTQALEYLKTHAYESRMKAEDVDNLIHLYGRRM
jgi:predicted phage terminase large subunit-like protein